MRWVRLRNCKARESSILAGLGVCLEILIDVVVRDVDRQCAERGDQKPESLTFLSQNPSEVVALRAMQQLLEGSLQHGRDYICWNVRDP